jgi:ABC-type nitrate/sulfonate/bicarbonate transport system substrate-binding protein
LPIPTLRSRPILSELFQADKAGVKSKFFLFASDGYPPYGTTIVTLQKTVATKPDLVQRFVKATAEAGRATWKIQHRPMPSSRPTTRT